MVNSTGIVPLLKFEGLQSLHPCHPFGGFLQVKVCVCIPQRHIVIAMYVLYSPLSFEGSGGRCIALGVDLKMTFELGLEVEESVTSV